MEKKIVDLKIEQLEERIAPDAIGERQGPAKATESFQGITNSCFTRPAARDFPKHLEHFIGQTSVDLFRQCDKSSLSLSVFSFGLGFPKRLSDRIDGSYLLGYFTKDSASSCGLKNNGNRERSLVQSMRSGRLCQHSRSDRCYVS